MIAGPVPARNVPFRAPLSSSSGANWLENTEDRFSPSRPKRIAVAHMGISKNTQRTNRGVRDSYGTGSFRISKGP